VPPDERKGFAFPVLIALIVGYASTAAAEPPENICVVRKGEAVPLIGGPSPKSGRF
jgi:hypothetical protein